MPKPSRQNEIDDQHRSQYELRMDGMEGDYEAALDRLLQGIPQHPSLQAQLAAKGYCKITIRNVAKEAGHSHNPLYDNKDRYKDILERIKSSKPLAASKHLTERDKDAELRQTKKDLEQEKRDALTENMGLLIRISKLQDQNKKLSGEINRIKKRIEGN